jgi:hypothetical protein
MSYQDFPPALMVLSPRLTTEGDPSASVAGIDTTPLADGAVVYCLATQQAYRLNKQSSVGADGNTVIAPLHGPGRWIGSIGATAWTLNGEWTPAFQCFPFTAVTQSGGGPTIAPIGTPESVLPANTPLFYQVAITAPGGRGVATFDLSDDGGGTFFLTNQTIPADGLYSVPGRGFRILFVAGAYVLAETYDFATVFANIGNGALVGNYRIVGDSVEIRLVFTPGTTTDFGGGVGTPTSTIVLLPLPPGFQIDVDKIPVAVADPSGETSTHVIEALIATQLVVAAFIAQRIADFVVSGVNTADLTALPVNVPETLLAISVPVKAAA